jgi:hypothetical protein
MRVDLHGCYLTSDTGSHHALNLFDVRIFEWHDGIVIATATATATALACIICSADPLYSQIFFSSHDFFGLCSPLSSHGYSINGIVYVACFALLLLVSAPLSIVTACIRFLLLASTKELLQLYIIFTSDKCMQVA